MPTARLSLSTAFAAVLVAAAPSSADARSARDQVGPYRLEVLVDGVPVRRFEHAGETWLLGQLHDRYTLRITNHSGERVEAVATVDGLDTVDGQPGAYKKRGYLVPAWGSIDIEGWRTSPDQAAAAFRFGSVASSYAGRTGRARDVGVIGVAIFPERRLPPPPPRPVLRPQVNRAPAYDHESAVDSLRGPMPMPSSAPPPQAKASGGVADEPRARAEHAPSGLGTEFGESLDWQVQEVPFERQDATHPAALLAARYNDRAGLLALGIDVDRNPYAVEDSRRRTAEPFPVEERRYATPPPGWQP